MTARDKADQLINSFIPHVRWKMGQADVKERAKQCALITVEELILCYSDSFDDDWVSQDRLQYWQEVKQEIGSNLVLTANKCKNCTS